MNTAQALVQKPLKCLQALGIRAQLTIWYMIIFLLLIILFGAVFYFHLRSGLAANLDSQLQLRAQFVSGSIIQQDGALVLHDKTGELSPLIDVDDIAREGVPHNEHNLGMGPFDPDLDLLIQIRDAAGRTQYSTPAFLSLPAPRNAIMQALHSKSWLATITTSNGQHIRLYSQPLSLHQKIIGVVLVGAALSPLENTLQQVIVELLLLAPIVLLLGVVGSFWLAKRAFRPITRLTTIARTIQQGDLHSRVPIPHTNDEVHLLAVTFNEMIDHLEKQLYHQRRFLSDASHELRTPVAALRSMTEVALAQSRSIEEYTLLLQDMNGQMERLGHLITSLLTLARADEGNISFEREIVHLDMLVEAVGTTLVSLATERGIVLDEKIETNVTVMGDEARLMQVVMNLLDNALRYTCKGGNVILSLGKTSTHAILRVQDTGSGIPVKHLPHIFERFYRVDSARSRSVGGTGLGLSITKWIVSMHGGTITAESQLDKGSQFSVMLPLAKEVTSSSHSHQRVVSSVKE
jgi:two-component system, OmpR family, sensor kinase